MNGSNDGIFGTYTHSLANTHTTPLMVHRVGWLVGVVGRDMSIHAITDGFMHCYCLLGYCIVWRCKASKEQFDGRNSQVMTLKSTELKQRKHREVYIIQTKSHLHSFIRMHSWRRRWRTKTIWKSSEKVTIMKYIWLWISTLWVLCVLTVLKRSLALHLLFSFKTRLLSCHRVILNSIFVFTVKTAV